MMWKSRAVAAVPYDRNALNRSTVLNAVLLVLAIGGLYWDRRHNWYLVSLTIAVVAILGLVNTVRALRRGTQKPGVTSK